jgi:hypothetical protein
MNKRQNDKVTTLGTKNLSRLKARDIESARELAPTVKRARISKSPKSTNK